MNKIVFLFCCLFFCCVQMKADDSQGKSQITIKFVEQPLDSALVQLAKESEYRFVFQDNITNKHTKVNQSFENKTISQILNALFASTDYSYAIVYSSVVIYEKKIEQNSRVIQKKESKPFLIKGKIVDRENGDELWGTTVYIKGDESVGTVAKKDGTFSISTTNPNALLIVVSIGYYPQVVSIKDAGLIKLEQTEESKKVVIIG